eukprot:Hpha_TRINITY_DN15119_c1_g1::TRINITY_DN15119_c1_g1_i1::g.126760::m.126760
MGPRVWERFISGGTKEDIVIKRKMVPLIAIVLPVHLVYTWTSLSSGYPILQSFANIMGAVGDLSFILNAIFRLAPIGYSLDVYLVLVTFSCIAADMAQAARSWDFRSWTFVIILLDGSLVFGRDHLPRFIIPVLLIYMSALSVESMHRFGMYEGGYWGAGADSSSCNCASPPCVRTVRDSLGVFINVTIVFLVDFYLTRGFATGMRLQLSRVESSVAVAERVAAALARYDVDEAQHAIDNGGDLPEALVESLAQIVCNLRAYRDYLPEILLRHDTGKKTYNTVRPPRTAGGGEVEVGVVFTSIESCAELWAEYPKAMYEALKTHNTVLSDVSRENHGYEVKFTGDSLMVVFHAAANAVLFGVEAQIKLSQSEWPALLCEHPLCRLENTPEGAVLWHGVRVGIGINWGPAQPSQNPVTGRYDYLGSTVNTASGVLSALGHGGLTGMMQAVVDEVGLLPPGLGYESADGQAFLLQEGMMVYMAPMAERQLRGVAEPALIHLILPHSMIARRELVMDICSPDSENPRGTSGIFNSPLELIHIPTPPSPWSLFDVGQSHGITVHSLGLGTGVGSSATVRGTFGGAGENEVEAAVSKLLEVVETAAVRTEGSVVCVVSAVCVVGWNAGARCNDHVAQSAHFVGVLLPAAPLNLHTGAATGRLLSGTIGGARMRYVTIAGRCVELSYALADAAALHSMPFMAATEVGAYLFRERLAMGLGRWQERG